MFGQSRNQYTDLGGILSGNRPFPERVNVEKHLLGCLLQEPKLIPEASSLNFESAFYDPAHNIIFSYLLKMDEKSEKIDIITLADFLERKNELKKIGGQAYLLTLQNSIATTANLEKYVSIVKNYGSLRAMIKTFCYGIDECYDDTKEAPEILDHIESEIAKIANFQIEKEADHVEIAISEEIATITKIQQLKKEDPNALLGISTGFRDIDRKLNGMKDGEMYVLAARPSMGKTTLAMNIAVNIALNQIPVAIFSLEMNKSSLALRLMCAQSEMSPNDIYGNTRTDDFENFLFCAGMLKDCPIYIDDTNPLNILQIRARSRRLKEKHKIGFIVIDYLQIITSVDNSSAHYREREVAKISAGIKTLAKELEIPVMILAQLNRSAEGAEIEPGLEHLRESGAIEQDADVVALINGNRKTKNKASQDLNSGDPILKSEAKKYFEEGFNYKLIIAKNRNGETGFINLKFFPQYTRFKDAPITSKKENDYKDKNKFDNE